MVAWESCCGKGVVSDGVGPQGRGPHDLFGGVGCTTEIVIGRGAGVVDGDSSEMFKWGGGVIEESLLTQFKMRVGKGIKCLQEGEDYESVTIPVCAPYKNLDIVHWVVLSESVG